MKKTFVILAVLIAFGLLMGEGILLSGAIPIDFSELGYTAVFGFVSAYPCPLVEPGYPNDCTGS